MAPHAAHHRQTSHWSVTHPAQGLMRRLVDAPRVRITVPVRSGPRWSRRIPTRIAHGIGHGDARVFMEAIVDKAVIPRWRIPHRTPRFLRNVFTINNLREERNFRSPFRSQLRVGLHHTLQDCLRRLPTIGGRGTTQRDGGSARWRVRRSPVGRANALAVVADSKSWSARCWLHSGCR